MLGHFGAHSTLPESPSRAAVQPMTSPASKADDESAADEDVRALHKGALTNIAGQVARVAQPVLLLAAARLYGPSEWGLFVAGQAALQILAKASLLGLERGMLFWIPRATNTGASLAIRASATRVAAAALALSALAAVAIPFLAARSGVSPKTWFLMGLGLCPLALMELLVHATVGRRRMDVQVAVRDVLVPLATLGVAILFKLLGAGAWGLGAASAIGTMVGFGFALRACVKVFGAPALFSDRAPIPRELRTFSLPQWGSELALTFAYIDRLVLMAFTSEAVVGVYGVALQFGNTIRSLRGTFDPLVSAVASSIVGDRRPGRLDEAVAYAVRVVMLLQAPVAALFIFATVPLLTLFGTAYEGARTAIVIFSVGWTLHGVLGLASPVLGGFGESRRLLVSTIFALAVEALLLVATVPLFGLDGAAFGLVASSIAQALLQTSMLRTVVGRIPGRDAWREPTLIIARATLVGVVAGAIGEVAYAGAFPFAGFAGFALAYLPYAFRTLRPAATQPAAALAAAVETDETGHEAQGS